jgi:hypothetical protein
MGERPTVPIYSVGRIGAPDFHRAGLQQLLEPMLRKDAEAPLGLALGVMDLCGVEPEQPNVLFLSADSVAVDHDWYEKLIGVKGCDDQQAAG